MISKNIYIKGIVQGVGFRPFVYQKACKLDLKGFVSNISQGVWIYIEGPPEKIQSFIDSLELDKPIHAKIQSITIENCKYSQKTDFKIIESEQSGKLSAVIPPDIATCNDCLSEMNNPDNCRFQYPFINCTNCGPRFSIIKHTPYDRKKTSMADFQLCDACSLEFYNPDDRRFHAQATACQKCGPTLKLITKDQEPVEGDCIQSAIKMLKQGKILAVKGLGGFHLAVDACNNEAILRLRKKKSRPDKPFAIMAADMNRIQKFAILNDFERKVLKSPQSPIVILEKKFSNLLSEHIAYGPTLGVMLAYTPLHHLLLKAFLALVMTSGNISDEPIVSENNKAIKQLDFADFFLIHDRSILQACDDSIVRVVNHQTHIIRRSRGYVPAEIHIKQSMPKILAMGGHYKNTICLAHQNQAYLSQHLGDLSGVDSILWMEQTINKMIQMTGISPEYVACDFHPAYQSTRMAHEMQLPLISVQHHHAHIASCMAEYGLHGPVMGLVMDGTGYGQDKSIWGGEILICEGFSFQRVAHLNPVPMPGGESAIRHPWKMGLSWLIESFGVIDGENIFYQLYKKKIDRYSVKSIIQLIQNKIHSPLTSSMGRLFDSVSFFLGFNKPVTYEAQAAIELENIAWDTHRTYSYDFKWGDDTVIFIESMIREIITDIKKGVDRSEISGAFHKTLNDLFVYICHQLKKKYFIDQIVLSGGVFQNKRFFSGLNNQLMAQGFHVYTPSKVPCNDGGISLGQAYVGGMTVRKKYLQTNC
ncbi:carbamoyltransferase [Candidatus Magnetomorum sp. HK-1]|nr:carbamoyltransferase [Candidatus Magnetomorum sp. HK-1]